ncbi:hypothetical protein C7S16_0103 [Burkholderia thailandensis]|uniref:Uncharacterized protein n=1 Tax=Burkholderia thailandensis TaxID=57975 RepID=A0AAW9D5S6_BURTH|nr:hypothetical protein [Burkholderia thailandensis]
MLTKGGRSAARVIIRVRFRVRSSSSVMFAAARPDQSFRSPSSFATPVPSALLAGCRIGRRSTARRFVRAG